MPEYRCDIFNFSTKIKTQLARHEKTKKHLRNISATFVHPEQTNQVKKFVCNKCDSEFSTKSNLQRHKNKKCFKNNVSETEIYKTMLLEQQKVFN